MNFHRKDSAQEHMEMECRAVQTENADPNTGSLSRSTVPSPRERTVHTALMSFGCHSTIQKESLQ